MAAAAAQQSLCCVHAVDHIKKLPNADKAAEMMQELKRHIDPLLKARGWRVLKMYEICCCTSGGKNLAVGGFCCPKGDMVTSLRIALRLRTPGRGRDASRWGAHTLRDFEHNMKVLLHEVTHIVHAHHKSTFYELLAELTTQYEKLRDSGQVLDRTGMPIVGGRKMDTSRHNPTSMHEARQKALRAAEKRARTGAVLSGGGTVGGGSRIGGPNGQAWRSAAPGEMALLAAEQRRRQWDVDHGLDTAELEAAAASQEQDDDDDDNDDDGNNNNDDDVQVLGQRPGRPPAAGAVRVMTEQDVQQGVLEVRRIMANHDGGNSQHVAAAVGGGGDSNWNGAAVGGGAPAPPVWPARPGAASGVPRAGISLGAGGWQRVVPCSVCGPECVSARHGPGDPPPKQDADEGAIDLTLSSSDDDTTSSSGGGDAGGGGSEGTALPGAKRARGAPAAEWACSQCTLLNAEAESHCSVCGAGRHVIGPGQGMGKRIENKADRAQGMASGSGDAGRQQQQQQQPQQQEQQQPPGFRIERNVGGVEGFDIAYDVFSEEAEELMFTSGVFPASANVRDASVMSPFRHFNPWPEDWFKVINAVRDCGLLPDFILPNQSSNLTYGPNASFTAHFDSRYRWGEFVVGVSLGRAGTFYLTPERVEGRSEVNALLPRRSIYVMRGAALLDWKHGVRAITDKWTNSGQNVPRWNRQESRRCITFRATKTWSNFMLRKLGEEGKERLDKQAKFPPQIRRGIDGNGREKFVKLTAEEIRTCDERHGKDYLQLNADVRVGSRFSRSEVNFNASDHYSGALFRAGASSSSSSSTAAVAPVAAYEAQMQEALRLSLQQHRGTGVIRKRKQHEVVDLCDSD